MIRRIQTTNDLLDVIKSCPSGVIDDIYKIEYYIQGFDTVYEAEFTHEGDCLKVVLPSSELEKLENGILMRRAYYKVSDSSYPDGYYNLTFEDNMNVWLGGESSDPYERQYVTEKVLNDTLEDYALKTEIPDVSGYVQETNLKTINGESLVGKGDIVIQTTAENIECGPVSNSLFNFSNVNDGLIQITGSVEEINNTKEDKKPVFYIDVNFDGPSVMTSYADYMSIGAQIKQLGVENVVLYVRDISGFMYMPSCVDFNNNNTMTIGGYGDYFSFTKFYYYILVYNNNIIRCETGSLADVSDLAHNINGVQTWVVNQKYAKKSELKTINGESIVGSGDITIQATGGVTEEWLQNNMKTINGVSVVGPGDLYAPEPVYIGIDLDSKEFTGTYDEYKEVVSKYLNNYEVLKLIVNFESPSTGVFGDSYPSDVYIPTEGKIEIGGYFLDERDENNKRLVYYRIKDNDAAQKVEISFTPVPFDADIPDLTGYATQEWVSTQGYLTSHQDLTGYALKSEIPDVSGYALKSEVPSLTGYATETWVESKGYLTEHQSLADYALKSEIPDVSGYALKTEIPSLDGYVQGSNLKTINGESIVGSGDITIQATGGVTEEWVNSKGYATETWVSNQGYLTEHQSLAGYALKSEIPDVSGYALKSEIPDVSGYALKSEIPSLTGYATESWVTNQGYTTQTYVDNKIGQIDTLLDQMLG